MPRRTSRACYYVAALAVLSASVAAGSAHAGEVRYGYDALGRLIKADQDSGAITHRETFRYDRSGNRISHLVDGSINGSATGMIVTPLGGRLVVIPFDRQ